MRDVTADPHAVHEADAVAAAGRWGALSHPAYRYYAAGNAMSLLGVWVQRVAIGWLAWEQTRSESWVGLIAFAQFAPAFIVSIPFGAVADRFDNRRLSLLLNALFTLWAILLAVLGAHDRLTPEWLFAISLAYGCTAAAYGPVRLSIIPALVPKDVRASAVAINSVLFNGARLVGPAIAGVLLAGAGAGWAFLVNALSYLPLLLVLAFIPMTRLDRQAGPSRMFGDVAAGIAYVRDHALIFRQLLLTAWVALFARGALEMLPAIGAQGFGRGPAGYAALTIAAGMGAIISGIWLSAGTADVQRLFRATIGLNLGAGVSLFCLAYVDGFALGMALVAMLGFAATGAAIASQSVVQIAARDEFRGRVSSLWVMAGLGGTAIGALVLGLVADWVGLTLALAICGVAAALLPAAFLLIGGREAGEQPVAARLPIEPHSHIEGRNDAD